MPAPYLTNEIWSDFIHGANTHSFTHLQEIYINVADSSGIDRAIIATFSDHVFTRDPEVGDEHAAAFPGCSRNPGFFCPERYAFSLQLPTVVPLVCGSKVWCLTGADRYAQIPVVTQAGAEHLYAIIFTLDKIKGLPFDLHMQIRSAYPCTRKVPDTFGEVKFKHLARLRVENKHPKKNHERGRKVPKKL
jgi:hypothetical protein